MIHTDIETQNQDGILVTLWGEFGWIDGWPQAREDLGLNGLNDTNEATTGMKLISEEESDSEVYDSQAASITLHFENVKQLEQTKNYLYDEAKQRSQWGDYDGAEKVEDFAYALPSGFEVESV